MKPRIILTLLLASTMLAAAAGTIGTSAQQPSKSSVMTITTGDTTTTVVSVYDYNKAKEKIEVGLDGPLFLSSSSSGSRLPDIDDSTTTQAIVEGLTICGIVVLPLIALIVALMLLLNHFKGVNRQRFQLIETSLRTGQPLPPEFYASKKRRPGREFRSAVNWLAIGIGLTAFFLEVNAPVWPIGVIFIVIGAARIVDYYLGKKRHDSSNETSDPTSAPSEDAVKAEQD